MSSKVIFAATLLFSSFLVATAGAEPEIQDGEWEITVATEMEGMPVMMPAMNFRRCLTKENMAPNMEEPGQECEISDTKVDGNTASWKVRCQGAEGATAGRGQVTYADDKMTGTTTMTIEDEGETMVITQRITGHRLGECPTAAQKER